MDLPYSWFFFKSVSLAKISQIFNFTIALLGQPNLNRTGAKITHLLFRLFSVARISGKKVDFKTRLGLQCQTPALSKVYEQ